MTTDISRTERRPNTFDLGRWENEGGAPRGHSMDIQYGRRIESDRSWTVYQVFTGIPARADGLVLTGMSRLDATRGMISLNLANVGRRKERTRLSDIAVAANDTEAGRS